MKSEELLKNVIGKSELEAINLCADLGFILRVESEDGEDYVLTMDMRKNRINVEIENGIITKSRIG